MTVNIVTTEDLFSLGAQSDPDGNLVLVREDIEESTTVTTLYGGVGGQGEKGDPGRDGRPVTLAFEQGIPSATWTIPHSLPYQPIVIVVDSTGDVVEVEVRYEPGIAYVLAAYPFAGRANLY